MKSLIVPCIRESAVMCISFSSGGAVHTMSYMAEAKLRNRHMMEQYKSHLLRQQHAGKSSYNEAGLSMLRRLEENLSVARIREKNVSLLWGSMMGDAYNMLQ